MCIRDSTYSFCHRILNVEAQIQNVKIIIFESYSQFEYFTKLIKIMLKCILILVLLAPNIQSYTFNYHLVTNFVAINF